MKITFRVIRIGEMFELNGNTYIKKSTRTAQMIAGPTSKTFYIEQLANCKI
jgi:hypothetical protein